MMTKRRSNRIECNISANIISGDRACGGFIDNISEDGVEYLLTSEIKSSKDFIPERIITLNFQTSSGETLNLDCEVRWYLRTAPEDETLTVGMKILSPPSVYREFLKDINNKSTH